jgi:hypothetical protein
MGIVPSVTVRKWLLIAAALGIVLACGGMFQLVTASSVDAFNGGRLWLFVAWLLLMPLFVYMIRLRGKGKRAARDLAAEQQTNESLRAELRTPEGVRRIGGATPPEES